MPNRYRPEDPDLLKSLTEQAAEARAEMLESMEKYCAVRARIMALELTSNGQSRPQDIIPTIRSVIIQYLKKNREGGQLKHIRKYLLQFSMRPNDDTISSTLSRLKRDGIVQKSSSRSGYWVFAGLAHGQ